MNLKKKKITLINTTIIVILLFIISLYIGSRALPLTLFYAIVIFILAMKSNILLFFNSKKTFFLLSLIIFFTTYLLGFLPNKVNTFKYFKDVNTKNISQNQGAYGVVVAARSEWIAIFYAFKDKPLTGHGSFPEDKKYYYTNKIGEFLYDNNYINSIPNYDVIFRMSLKEFSTTLTKQIPTHSFFGYNLVAYGFFGSFLMLAILYYFTNIFLKNYKYLNFFFHFNFVTFLYNFYFSPWGAPHRILVALFFIALILKSEDIKKNLVKL